MSSKTTLDKVRSKTMLGEVLAELGFVNGHGAASVVACNLARGQLVELCRE
uniref:Uncharacterized protein n=1 Tax=Fagus sylvatica TaxID=28930 RepID=A0A2N9EDC6_FAGSY